MNPPTLSQLRAGKAPKQATIMSDTPRTDAIAIHPSLSVTSDYSLLEILARELERENASLRFSLKVERGHVADACNRIAGLRLSLTRIAEGYPSTEAACAIAQAALK